MSFNFLHMYVCQIITCACMVLNSPASGTSLEKNMFRHAAKIIADWSTALAVHFVRKSNDVYLQINNHREFLYLISSNHIYTDVLLLFFCSRGYAHSHTVTGADPQTTYKYRIRFMSNAENSEWGPHLTVSTTSKYYSTTNI